MSIYECKIVPNYDEKRGVAIPNETAFGGDTSLGATVQSACLRMEKEKDFDNRGPKTVTVEFIYANRMDPSPAPGGSWAPLAVVHFATFKYYGDWDSETSDLCRKYFLGVDLCNDWEPRALTTQEFIDGGIANLPGRASL